MPPQRFAPSLLVAGFGASGGLFVLAAWPTVVAALAILVCFRRVIRWPVLLLALLGCGAGAYRASECVSGYVASRKDAERVLRPPVRCFLQVEILDSPVVREAVTRLRVRVLEGQCDQLPLSRGLTLRLHGGPQDLRRGDRLELVAQLGVTRLFRNLSDLADPIPFAARNAVVASGSVMSSTVLRRGTGIRAWIDARRAHVRERIEATFSPAAVPLAKALVLGENDLSEEEDHSFKVSGLAHMLAVSGTHLVFAVVSIVTGIRALLCRIPRFAGASDSARYAYVFGSLVSLIYADFAGGSGSAWRAAWMLSAAFALRAFGRESSAAQAIAVSIAVALWFDPLVALDLSFLLSLGATVGLMTLGRHWASRVSRIKTRGVRALVLSVAATVSSTIPCSVLLASLSTEVSLLGIAANTFAAPFGEVIALPVCLLHSISAGIPPLERGLAMVASGALLIVRQVALLSAKAEGYGLPLLHLVPWQYASLVGLFSSGVGWLGTRDVHTRRELLVVAGLASVGFGFAEWGVRAYGAPEGVLRVTFLDVEQGDSTLIDLPDGSLVLVDAGGFVGSSIDPGEQVVLPILRARRRKRLDVVVLSHPHPDHFGGLLSVLSKVEVGELWDNGQGEAEGAGPLYSEILKLARSKSVVIRRPAEFCQRTELGGAELAVFGPCPDFEPNIDANDNSVVFRLAHKQQSVLLVGDAEAEEEEKLVQYAGVALRSTVLKVGHHGSRTSSNDRFLVNVRPRVGVISCGVRNRFGHPHAESLRRLARQSVEVWRIDEQGGLQLVW
jgi:competence protein ComEC